MLRRSFWVWTGCILVLFAADRITRIIAFAHMPRTLIPGLLQSIPTTNAGIALGIPLPGTLTYALAGLLLLAVVALAWSAYRKGDTQRLVACLCIASGAISNLLDRFEYGYVRDFLKLSFWPTTANIADWCITLGTLVLFFSFVPKRHTRSEVPQ